MSGEIGHLGGSSERPARFFADAGEWRAWLEANHDSAADIWMGLNKRHVADRGLVWDDAVREALCFGWIDSQVQRVDGDAVRQRWTPRRPGSVWSAINVAAAQQLIADGRMRPPGLAAFEARRADREAIYSYEQSDGGSAWDADHEAALRASASASAFWDAATPGYRKICTHWVTTAKHAATRARRLAQLVECCANGELIPGQRYGNPPVWLTRARAASESATTD